MNSGSKRGQLASTDGGVGDDFGISVALDGDKAVVGTPWNEQPSSFPDEGAAYVFWPSLYPTYCISGISASACTASIFAMGTASASASSGFYLSAIAVEGAKDGLFFFGTSGRQANPWGNGTSFQCVVPPVNRAGFLFGVGTAGSCDGTFTQDLNAHWCSTCPRPQHNPGAGAVVQAQLWYRDFWNTSNQSTSLSNAIEFTLSP